MKLLVQTALGIVALIAGITFLFLFMSSLSSEANFIFLVLALLLIGAGAFLFIRVSKITNADSQPGLEVAPTESGSKLLEKNNQMIEDWGKVNTKKDSLKAIQIAANAQEQVAKEKLTS